jgi:hypothetical protein
MFNHGPLTQAELQDATEALERVEKWEERRLSLLKKSYKQRFTLKKRINMQNMVAVHLTDYFPKDGIIKTTADYVVEIDGLKVRLPLHSIHFSLNGPVGGHGRGNWEGKKYAVIIPLNKIAKRIVTLNPVDTWIVGKLKVPRGTIILGHQENLQRKKSGNARIVIVKGDIHQAVRDTIAKMGLPVASIGGWGWSFEAENLELASKLIMGGLNPLNSFDGGDFTEFAQKLGYKIEYDTSSVFLDIEGLFKSVALDLPEFYDVSPSKGGSSPKSIKNTLTRAESLKEKLKEFYIKREKQSFNTSEKLALDKIKKSLEHCVTELKLYVHKVERVSNYFGKKIKSAEDLSQTEKEWLILEFSIVKKLENAIATHDKSKVNSLLRKIGKIERRTYKKYKKLKARLDELSNDHTFPVDISDLYQELNAYEAFLAKYFSLGANEIQKKAAQGKWDKVSKHVEHLEKYLINAEDMLKTMHEVLESRYKKFSDEF